jgi:hypothetical protein
MEGENATSTDIGWEPKIFAVELAKKSIPLFSSRV